MPGPLGQIHPGADGTHANHFNDPPHHHTYHQHPLDGDEHQHCDKDDGVDTVFFLAEEMGRSGF